VCAHVRKNTNLERSCRDIREPERAEGRVEGREGGRVGAWVGGRADGRTEGRAAWVDGMG
jgi:hypothetical protein